MVEKHERGNIDEWEELKDSNWNGKDDAIAYWLPTVNPKVINLEEIKTAILLAIASHGDVASDRGRVSVLLSGKEGTGKSDMVRWVAYQLNTEITDTASEVGLKGDARGEEITKGALPRANGDILVVEELDEMARDDRKGLLTSMEEGMIEIEKGGMSASFEAECRVLATCNRIGQFRDELIDRFDFHFEMEEYSRKEQMEIMSGIVQNWFKDTGEHGAKDLRNFINYIRSIQPRMTNQTRKIADILIQIVIKKEKEKTGIRKKQGILRVATSIAKLNMRDLESSDIARASARLFDEMEDEWYQVLSKMDRGKKIFSERNCPLNDRIQDHKDEIENAIKEGLAKMEKVKEQVESMDDDEEE